MSDPAPSPWRQLPFRFRALLALLPGHMRDEHEREILLALTTDDGRLSWGALAIDVLRAAPGAHADVLRQDARVALRQVRRGPIFALVAVLTLSLGFGGNLAFFTLMDGVLFRPLPFRGEAQLVTLVEENLPRGMPTFGISPANFRDYTRDTTLFTASSVYQVRSGTLRLGGDPERILTAAVSGDFFRVFLERPVTGRGLDRSDDVAGSNAVVVSEEFATRRLGGVDGVIDREVDVSGRRVRIVGVMPASFDFPNANVEIWRPLALGEPDWQRRGARFLAAVARLRDGVTVQGAGGTLSRVAASLSGIHASNKDWTILVRDLRSSRVAPARTQLYIVWVAGTLVLLLAVANVAGLFMARAVTRQREFALRAALGARAGRVTRQVMTEALLVTLAAAAVGTWIAWLVLGWIRANGGEVIPRLAEVTLGWRTWALGMVIALGSAAVLAALSTGARRPASLWGALGSGRGGMSRARWRLLRALVTGEVAFACFILITASLVTRTVRRLLDQPMGFEARGTVTFRVEAPYHFRSDVPADSEVATFRSDRRRVSEGYDALLSSITALPGVTGAGAINRLPLTGEFWVTSVSRTDDVGPSADLPVWVRPVTPGFLEAMRTRLLRGRPIERSDMAGAERVVIVDEALAARAWGTEDPVGRHLNLDSPPGEPTRARVIGVVESIHMNQLDDEYKGTMYVPIAQAVEGLSTDWGFDVIIRGSAGLKQVDDYRSLVRTHFPDAVMYNVSTMEDLVATSVADRRLNNLVLGIFSLLALLLATVGIGGALMLIIRERQRELAIRIALGASVTGVWWRVQAGGLAIAAVGAVAGTILTLASTRLLASLVYGIPVRDPVSFIGAPLVLCLAAFIAIAIPATRAILVNPVSALRDT